MRVVSWRVVPDYEKARLARALVYPFYFTKAPATALKASLLLFVTSRERDFSPETKPSATVTKFWSSTAFSSKILAIFSTLRPLEGSVPAEGEMTP